MDSLTYPRLVHYETPRVTVIAECVCYVRRASALSMRDLATLDGLRKALAPNSENHDLVHHILLRMSRLVVLNPDVCQHLTTKGLFALIRVFDDYAKTDEPEKTADGKDTPEEPDLSDLLGVLCERFGADDWLGIPHYVVSSLVGWTNKQAQEQSDDTKPVTPSPQPNGITPGNSLSQDQLANALLHMKPELADTWVGDLVPQPPESSDDG